MPSDLSSYLAAHYLTADPKPSSSSSSKKRKRKQPTDAGLLITDDSETGWTRPANGDDSDGDGPATVSGTSAEFRKAKKSAWKTVGAPAPSSSALAQGDAAAADAILASAAAESAAAGGGADDDAPVLMSDGTHAGLQTAASVTAQLERRKRLERADYERNHAHEKEAETVYRDATGRRVDLTMKRAEARRAAADAEAKKELAREALRGEVQVEAAARRREELEDARTRGVARGVDDVEMNRELKEKTRWGDTMADFVGREKGGAVGKGAGGSAAAAGKKVKGRPTYQGAWAPNRYGIRPGYRWDGVDRGNGFEAERFKAINRKERNKGLEYNWQMDE